MIPIVPHLYHYEKVDSHESIFFIEILNLDTVISFSRVVNNRGQRISQSNNKKTKTISAFVFYHYKERRKDDGFNNI